MTTSSTRRGVRGAAAALTACALLAPSAAQAADAPLRTIGLTATGERTADYAPVAVSLDGREVIQRDYSRVYVRNVAAGTTSPLVTGADDVSASNDTKIVAVVTNQPLVAADTDTEDDVYVINRAAGNAATLVTGPSLGLEIGGAQKNVIVDSTLISGNGNVVRFGVSRAVEEAGGGVVWKYERWRFDRTTGVSTKYAAEAGALVNRLDDAGQVEITETQVKVGGRTWPIPPSTYKPYAWIAPDGGSVVFRPLASENKLTVLNTTTGATRLVTAPSWINPYALTIYAPTNAGGDFIVISTPVSRPAGERVAIGRLQVSNAAITQTGGDVPVTVDMRRAVSANLAFAATNLHLAQLGTTPLPGAEPSLPGSTAKAWDYLSFGDATCSKNLYGVNVWTRPYVHAKKGAQGTDLRTPARAVVKVTMANGIVANHFTINAGVSRDLNTGRIGGYTIDATVTFTDGSTLSGSNVIAAHPTPACTPFWF